MKIEAMDPASDEARELIAQLDADLISRYPGESTHGIDAAEFRAAGGYFVTLRTDEGELVGCGAFRPVAARCVEVKRLFVMEAWRGRGFARSILKHLEEVAAQRGAGGVVLETGVRQPEAIALYERAG